MAARTRWTGRRHLSIFEGTSEIQRLVIARSISGLHIRQLGVWRDVNQRVWAESTRRDYESRIALIEADPIAEMPVARVGVADVDRHARMRKTGVGEAAIRGRHSVLRAALAQALRWAWVGSNPASQAVLR